MPDARDRVLGRLRRSLGREISQPYVPAGAAPSRGPRPALGAAPEAAFIARVEAAAGTLSHTDSPDGVVQEVVAYLAAQGLSPRMVATGEPPIGGLVWPEDLHVEQRAATAEDQVALTVAYAGVAETGSLALLSGPDSPTTLNFLPDHFLCLLPRQRILGHLEDLWERLRQEPGGMPRAVNLITGPSRTADVEQTIQMGAHGPRRLHVVLLEG